MAFQHLEVLYYGHMENQEIRNPESGSGTEAEAEAEK